MSNELKNINEIPVRTYDWLDVNTISINTQQIKFLDYNLNYFEDINLNGIQLTKIKNKLSKPKNYFGLEKDLLSQSLSDYNAGFKLEVNTNIKAEKNILVNYCLDKQNNFLIDTNEIILHDNSSATVYINFASVEDFESYNQSHTQISLKNNCYLKLVYIQNFSCETEVLQSIKCTVNENSKVELVVAQLGGNMNVINIDVDLLGKDCSSNLQSIYFGDKNKKLDINYVTNHIGEQTISTSLTKGALFGNSKKTFKGCVNFKKGSLLSDGKLDEQILVLSPNVKNSSVPLLLCDEDNVSGQHSATVSQIDEDALFYLMTRGIDETEAKQLLLSSYFNNVLDLIEDETTKSVTEKNICIRIKNNG